MKKTITILLLAVLLFNMVGFYFVFMAQRDSIRSEIKHRIKQGIAEQDLHLFTFTTAQLQDIAWERAGKEFKLLSQMYDVVRAETNGDTTYYWCVNDTEESILFAQLDELVKQELGDQDENHNRRSKKSSKQIKSLKYTLPKRFTNETNNPKGLVPGNGISLFYAPPLIEAISPPPQSV